MKTPEIPADEDYRLDALHSLDILDTPPEADFDAIVRLGSELFDVPICLVSLIDRDRQWFKACIGLAGTGGPRAESFCGHAILNEGAFVVLDATKDERFSDNPAVTGEPFVRFYAGMPIRLPSGYQIGTVCLVDTKPHESFDQRDVRLLGSLAEIAVTTMGLRGLRIELDAARNTIDRLRTAVHLAPSPIALADFAGRVEEANAAFNDLCRTDPMQGDPAGELLAVSPEDWAAAIGSGEEGEVATGTDGRRLRVVPDPGGLILVGTPEGETP
jgi:hypothetical protein